MKNLGNAIILLVSLLSLSAWAADGLITVKSAHSVKDTIDRFEAAAKARGLNVFLRLDHAAGAKKIGKELRPTELLVFGNPQGGTPLMECAQSAGIDLPLKALAWQDAAGQVGAYGGAIPPPVPPGIPPTFAASCRKPDPALPQ